MDLDACEDADAYSPGTSLGRISLFDPPPVRVRGDDYELVFLPGQMPVARVSLRGQVVADLLVASGCDADGRTDVPGPVEGPFVSRGSEGVEVSWRASTSLWPQVTYRFFCRPESFRYAYRVCGRGVVDRALYFCYRKCAGAGAMPVGGPMRASTAYFLSLWDPEPNSLQKQRFSPGERAVISVTGDTDCYGGNWFFTPGPFCYALEVRAGWLAVGLVARPGEMHFTEFEAVPGDGFGLALRYDGHALVRDKWDSPVLEFMAAADEYSALGTYCSQVARAGGWRLQSREPEAWWMEPIFCGWGEQCVLAGLTENGVQGQTVRAADFSTQQHYEAFLAELEEQGIYPGTIVVDDKWQEAYGTNTPDPIKWPDMAGFIAAQHARGRRVLLWLKAWDPEGLASEECILDREGRPLAADPTEPRYEARLRKAVRSMMLDLGADGFKLDFTHKMPAGAGMRSAGGLWGVELLRRLVQIIREEMRQVRPDAVLVTHTANPAFADLVDVLRLNDVPQCPGQNKSYLAAMEHRARVARCAGDWLIDTDNWPSPDRSSFLEYVRVQPRLGIPSLYYVTRIRWQTPGEPWLDDPLREEDYGEIRRVWSEYRRELGRRKGRKTR